MPGTLCEQCGHNARPEAVRCSQCGSRLTIAAGPDNPFGQLAEGLDRSLGDQYRLEERVGASKSTVVFRVSDVRMHRDLVLKALDPRVQNRSETAGQFRRQAETAAELSHPNIVPVLSVGEVEGIPYYLMPMIEGESLGTRIRREGGVSFDAAVGIVRDLAAALDFAHGAGVVHRDVTPDNIFLENATGRSLLVDFGIAVATAGVPAISGSGVVVGAPLYVAPELASEGGDADARSDVYSLGVVVFEMLAGAVPYAGDTPQSILAQHVMSEVPSIAERCAGAPSAFEAVMKQVLAKKPEDRFQAAGAFARAMEAVRETRGARPSGGSVISRQIRSDVSQFRSLRADAGEAPPHALREARDPAQAAEVVEAVERQLKEAIAGGRGLDVAAGIGALLEGLGDRRPAYRKPVERALATLTGDERVIELLAQGWHSGEDEDQAQVEVAIVGLEGGGRILVDLACRDRSAALMLLADRVGALDPDAIRLITGDERTSVVQAFLQAVRESTRPSDRIEAWLQFVFRHPSPEIRRQVLEVAGERGGPMAERLGRLGLTAREGALREAALMTLGRSGRKEVLPALAQRLENGPPAEQAAAAVGLGTLGFREAVPVLQKVFARKKLLKYERGPVQVAAAEALAALPFPEARQALETLAGDSDARVATVASAALNRSEPRPAE